jgi:hypothetical protein
LKAEKSNNFEIVKKILKTVLHKGVWSLLAEWLLSSLFRPIGQKTGAFRKLAEDLVIKECVMNHRTQSAACRPLYLSDY